MPSADTATFERLYDLHSRELLQYCFRRTGDASAAEDLVAIVFLEAWRKRSQMRLPTARAWLYGIATNVAHNHRRAARRHDQALTQLRRARPFSSAETEQVEENMRELLTQLRRLPRRELDVVGLCLWSGLGYEDAAHALGIPVGTVRSRLSRARKRLDGWRTEATCLGPQPMPNHNKGVS